MRKLVNWPEENAYGKIMLFDESLTPDQRAAIAKRVVERLSRPADYLVSPYQYYAKGRAVKAAVNWQGSNAYHVRAIEDAKQGDFVAAVWNIRKFERGVEYVNKVVNTWIVEQEAHRQGFPTDDPDWLLVFLDLLEEQGNDVSLLR